MCPVCRRAEVYARGMCYADWRFAQRHGRRRTPLEVQRGFSISLARNLGAFEREVQFLMVLELQG